MTTQPDGVAPAAPGAGFAEFRRATQPRLFAVLPEHIGRLRWDRDRIVAHQQHRLGALLAHAVAHSPFHQRRLRGIVLDRVTPTDLRRLPVMTKAEMMAAFDEVVTDRRLTLARVEDALERTATEPEIIDGRYLAMASGGSSGQRGVFLFDAEALVEFSASMIRQSAARAQAFGGLPPGGMRIALVAAASPIHATSGATRLLVGSPLEFVPLPVTLPVADIVDGLNRLQPVALSGYPSMLARLAVEQREGRLDIHPLVVTCTSETVRPHARQAIKQVFGAPIVNTFGSSEGLTGVSPPDDPAIVFAEDGCIVELVDEDDRPAGPGEPSAAVLVTNLYNLTQPLIRYRMDDRFVPHPADPAHGYLRAEVEGRSSDILRFGEVTVHPHVVSSVLTHDAAVVDFQVRQRPNGVDVDVVAPAGVDTERLAEGVRAALAGAGLAAADVSVRTVEAIARDPRTGKAARFVALPAR